MSTCANVFPVTGGQFDGNLEVEMFASYGCRHENAGEKLDTASLALRMWLRKKSV
jgi:hypothetical protein